jgi:hypothetical protein
VTLDRIIVYFCHRVDDELWWQDAGACGVMKRHLISPHSEETMGYVVAPILQRTDLFERIFHGCHKFLVLAMLDLRDPSDCRDKITCTTLADDCASNGVVNVEHQSEQVMQVFLDPHKVGNKPTNRGMVHRKIYPAMVRVFFEPEKAIDPLGHAYPLAQARTERLRGLVNSPISKALPADSFEQLFRAHRVVKPKLLAMVITEVKFGSVAVHCNADTPRTFHA